MSLKFSEIFSTDAVSSAGASDILVFAIVDGGSPTGYTTKSITKGNFLGGGYGGIYGGSGSLSAGTTVTMSGFALSFSGGDVGIKGTAGTTDLFYADESADKIGIGLASSLNAKLTVKGLTSDTTDYSFQLLDSSNVLKAMFRNDGQFRAGLGDVYTNTGGVGGAGAIKFTFAQSNDGLYMTNAPLDGTSSNTVSDNLSIYFQIRNSAGDLVSASSIRNRMRNVTAGSEYSMTIINSNIHSTNSTGTNGKTVISTSGRETYGDGNSVLQVENRNNDTNTVVLFDQFAQNTGMTFGVRSGSAGTGADTYNWKLLNNHEFTHNYGQLSTGDFVMRSVSDTYTFFMDASADNVGMGTNTPDASAKLAIVSTTKGFLPPVMTGTQAEAIATPAQGLLVFATAAGSTISAAGWWGWDGATWKQLA